MLHFFFKEKKNHILIQIALKFIPRGPVDDNGVLIQIMAWHGADGKPLPEPMLIKCYDAIWVFRYAKFSK